MSLWSPSITTGVLKSPREMRAGASSVARSHIAMSSSTSISASTENTKRPKLVWVWTENKKVMTAAVERGWSTFLFNSASKGLADEWNCLALIRPLFIERTGIFDGENKKIGVVCQVSSPRELELLQPDEVKAENVVVNFGGEWQIIPAENIVAAFQGCEKNVFAIASTCNEAQTFFEALEQGLGGVVLKAEDVDDILKLKDYFDRRNEVRDHLPLITATVTQVKVVGMGDRVCVDLCSLMQPGEGLMVGSFARGLFLVHSECFESRYIASRPFRVNAGPVHAYVAVPGGRTCYLSELEAGKEVIVVDGNGLQRTAIVGRVKVETRQLVLVEAEEDSESKIRHSIFLQNAETVGLVCPRGDNDQTRTFIPVTSLSVGDKVIMRLQGGARHTGIEIKEFILEK